MKKITYLILGTVLLFNCAEKEINEPPSSFEILETNYFQGCGGSYIYQKEQISFVFNEPKDANNDSISYEMNFGGLTWDLPNSDKNNYTGVTIKNGIRRYTRITDLDLGKSFPDFSKEKEIELKITARDGRGGESSASVWFNVTGADQDLGKLTLPDARTLQVNKNNELIDEKIEYTFTVEKEFEYSIEFTFIGHHIPGYLPIIDIRNKSNGEIMNIYDYQNQILKGNLPAGTYVLSVRSRWETILNGFCRSSFPLKNGTLLFGLK